jgi:hypothetical protein
LGLALVAAQDLHPSQEVKDAFRNLKEAISLRCLNASGMTNSCARYGERVIGLMESSPLSSEGELFLDKLEYFPARCESLAEKCDEAITGMRTLVEEISATVHRITTVFNESK